MHIQDLISSDEPPSKARAAHEGQWELSDIFMDKLARARALRQGRVVQSPGRDNDYAEVLAGNGERVPTANPLGIPVAGVKGGSVDLAGRRFERGRREDGGGA
jgi:hypothetical protein